jgi:5'-3' exonuclease
MGHLTHEEMQVGIIFGFFKQILSLAKQFNSNQFVFVWDSTYSKRKEIYSEYKNNRKRKLTEEEKKLNGYAYNQFDLLKNELLNRVGFTNNYCFTGYEGDDLIASILNWNFKLENIIVSSDNDLYQLLKSGIRIISTYSITKKHLYTFADFVEEWNIFPNLWPTVKAITGCLGDNVKGLPGVGEKTAIKYLTGKLASGKTKSLIFARENDILHRNMPIVELPFTGTPKIHLKNFDTLYLKNFLEVFDKYNFQSLTTKEAMNQWKKHLELE